MTYMLYTYVHTHTHTQKGYSDNDSKNIVMTF